MPIDFLKKRRRAPAPDTDTGPRLVADEVEAQEHELKVTYRAKTSQGVRMTAGAQALRELPSMVDGVAQTAVEVVEPLGVEFAEASPMIVRPAEALQWINANHDRSPITRHSLIVLESTDAVDPAFETIAIALLSGDLDTQGYPSFDALVGGVASHWDELTGDIIVRGVVGWGGRGVRGDTERAAQKVLTRLLSNVLASQHAQGFTPVERPIASQGAGGLVCAHCGFASAHERAFYCPKCGMRMLRG